MSLQKLNEALSNFPFTTIRPLQEAAIKKIIQAFDNDKNFVMLEAPTGIGKSAIAMTVARYMQSAYLITPQKILQDQYIEDFGGQDHPKPLVELKGRNAYMCMNANDDQTTCDISPCRNAGKTSLPECEEMCKYHQQIQMAQDSHVALFNFKSFLYQYNMTLRFAPRELLIIDEGHNTEAELMSFIEMTISDEKLQEYSIVFSEMAYTSDYIEYFKEIKLEEKLKQLYKTAMEQSRIKTADSWERMLRKLRFVIKETENEVFIPQFTIKKDKKGKTHHVISLKPLYVRKYAKEQLFSSAKKVLIMSATLLSKGIMTDCLGIDKADCEFIDLPSTFPKENRQIKRDFVGYMTYKEKTKTLPKMVKKIENILLLNSTHKGIIHTHSFSNSQYIKEHITGPFRSRLLFQSDFPSREAMIREHTNSFSATVIVAPAMHEGLDLKDDLSRFQIICKIPYASLMDNKQLALRVKQDWNYYNWMTALKLVQMYGRSVRHEKDWANTYVLDTQFNKFLQQAKRFLPKWFTEAVV